MPEPEFTELEDWLAEYFLPMFRRTLGGEYRWCRQWWRHGEAISRLTALWHAWEVLRIQPGTGIAHLVPRAPRPPAPVLLGARGPFYQCSEEAHREPHEAAADPAPAGWWDRLPDPAATPRAMPAPPAATRTASLTTPGWLAMTTPDLRRAGLDPAHILAICEHVAASGGCRPVGLRDGGAGRCPGAAAAARAARAMRTALTRAGYDTALACPGRHWDLLVTGWDGHALESRLAAMRTVIAQLGADPTATAAAVIGRYRDLSARSPGSRLGMAALEPGRRGTAGQCGRPLRHPCPPRSRRPARRYRQRAAAARHLDPGTGRSAT